MTEEEISDYLYDGILLDLEDKSFQTWYDYQYQKTSLRKVRQVPFRKELIRRLTLLHDIYTRREIFEILEKLEKYSSYEF
jgi:hypothetical protein